MGKRPSFTIEDLPENWEDIVTEKMRDEGYCVQEVIREFGLKGYTLRIHGRMCRDYPEYNEVFENGKAMSEAWWITEGRKNLNNTKYNNAMYCFHMKNRHGWRDSPLAPAEKESPFNDKVEKAEFLEKFVVKKDEMVKN